MGRAKKAVLGVAIGLGVAAGFGAGASSHENGERACSHPGLTRQRAITAAEEYAWNYGVTDEPGGTSPHQRAHDKRDANACANRAFALGAKPARLRAIGFERGPRGRWRLQG